MQTILQSNAVAFIEYNLPIHLADEVVLQIDPASVSSLHSPMKKHGFRVLRTKSLDLPSAYSLANIDGDLQRAIKM